MNIAELGIGTNHEASVSGNILEDEKVMGTIHVAFGNNISMGGTCNVGIHIDGVVTKPTVFIDQKKIMDNGSLLI
jgi:leucyl aminopeptidase (aminopeptidase T)